MSEKEKSSTKALAEALKVLPDGKKEFLLGYAEGVAAMVKGKNADGVERDPPSDTTVTQAPNHHIST